MLGLPWVTWVRFGLWLALGLAIYFWYGFMKRSSSARGTLNGAGRLCGDDSSGELGNRYAVSFEQTTIAPCGSNARPTSPAPATTSSGSPSA